MNYRVYAVDGDLPQALSETASWLESEGDGYRYEFESEPLFGSPSHYEGVLLFRDGLLVVGRGENTSTSSRVLDRLEQLPEVDCTFEDLSLEPSEQYALVKEYDGYATRIAHPRHSENRVSEIARMESLRENQSVRSDDVRDEARNELYPISSGDIRKDGETVSFYTDGTLSFSNLPIADVEIAAWVATVVTDIRE